MLDPEQEFQLVVLTSSLRLLISLAAELDTGETSVDFRRAQLLLAGSITDLPSIEEVREFDDHLLTLIDHLKRDRERAGQRLRSNK